VLCCAVLCCAVLCCAVLCCAVLCCAVLCCAVLGARDPQQQVLRQLRLSQMKAELALQCLLPPAQPSPDQPSPVIKLTSICIKRILNNGIMNDKLLTSRNNCNLNVLYNSCASLTGTTDWHRQQPS